MRRLIVAAARAYKGSGYTLDPAVSTGALISIAIRRALALCRGFLVGVNWGRKPGAWIFVEQSVILRNRGKVTFGRAVTLSRGVLVDGLSRNGVSIGDRVSIGPYAIIEATGVISSIGAGCSIGSDSGLGAFSYIGAAGGVQIGSNVIMGQRVSFHSENHVHDDLTRPIREQGVTRKGIVVEDDCWVGANVTFLDGAHVGHGCVVAAGSVVRGSIPPRSIIGGVPAKIIRERQ